MAGNEETITIVRPPAKGRFGDLQPGTPARYDVGGVLFAPGPSIELVDAQNTVDTDGTAYLPPGAEAAVPGNRFLPTDKAEVRGDLYSVVGDPQVWAGEGTVLVLRKVTG